MVETVTVAISTRQALDTLNFYGSDARLPPPYDKLSHSEIAALPRESIERTFGFRVEAEVRKRISEMSPSMRLPERPFGGG